MRSMLVHISNPFHERQNLNLCCVVLLLYVNIHVFQQGCVHASVKHRFFAAALQSKTKMVSQH